jgi:biotin operon repressor
VTSPCDDLFGFIGASFRSVWALELLLLLKREPRLWSRDELISTLRASELVVNKAIDELVAAGFLTLEGDGARYTPVSDDIARHVGEVEQIYAARPDAVRRAIISTTASGATAFADAFRLRKD